MKDFVEEFLAVILEVTTITMFINSFVCIFSTLLNISIK